MNTVTKENKVSAPIDAETEKARADSASVIEKNIATYAANGKANDALIQETAIKILIHVEKFREPSLANKAVEGLPASARKNALLGFFEKYGKLKYNSDSKRLVFKKEFKTNLEGAKNNPFWTFKPEPEYKPMDSLAEIEKLIKRLTNRAEQADARDKISEEHVLALQALKETLAQSAPANDTAEQAEEQAAA